MLLVSPILGAGAVGAASEGVDCQSWEKKEKVPDMERNIICFKYISQGHNNLPTLGSKRHKVSVHWDFISTKGNKRCYLDNLF